MKKNIVIIGAGFGGLSAAALLSHAGHKVTLLEKNQMCGGRAMIHKQDGFTFDMGPSWYLMPDIFEQFFNRFNKKTSDYFQLTQLSPSYRIYFGPNDYIDIPHEIEKIYELFDELEKDGAKKLKKYLERAEYKYNTAVEHFLYKEYKNITDFFNKKIVFEGLKLHVFEDMKKYVSRYFTSKKAQQILQYTIVFLGGSPSKTPAIYSLMSHVDLKLGVWYPEGGMNAVAHAIESIGKENNAQYIYNTPVEHIDRKENIIYVHTKEKTYEADIVISNADYQFTETKLLAKDLQSYKDSYWEKCTIAPSGFIIYLGLDKPLPQLKHHTLFFENDWEQHFEQIFSQPQWPDSPSYYICNPSKTDKNVAPENNENLFILVPVAANLKDTDALRQEYYEKIINHISSIIGEDLKKHIITKKIFTHKDFTSYYNAYKGTALGLSHTIMQTAYFRPALESKKCKDLYYVGQYTHPGIGVPMTIISAEIVADKIIKKYGSNS